MDHSWGFEEPDEDDARADEPAAAEEPLTGADADGIVTVIVDGKDPGSDDSRPY
jgi:hypothetical protein